MALIDDIHVNLRLSTGDFDAAELEPLMAACRRDLELAGVAPAVANDDSDPLIARAIVLYCKAHFGYGTDGERYKEAYDSIRRTLAHSQAYAPTEGDMNG